MLILLLMSTFALVCSDVSHLQHQHQEELDSAPPAKPYAFTYTAGRYPGHADRQHTEVSDGSGVIRGQYSYTDPRLENRTQYGAAKQGFHSTLHAAPPNRPRDTEAVEQAKNHLYNTIAAEHQQNPHPHPDASPMADSNAHWVFAQHGQVPSGALPANDGLQGQEPMYVARAYHAGSLIPGKLQASFRHAYVTWDDHELAKDQYEVLVGGSNRWASASGGRMPRGARPGGETERGELLYICRVNHNNGIITGKAQQSERTCYVPYDGRELRFTQYFQILLA